VKVIGIEGMSREQVAWEVKHEGARFIVFECCVSVLLATSKEPTDIYLVRKNESAIRKGLIWTIITLLLGWWGIPWGPIYTIKALTTNFNGGKDVTQAVLANFDHYLLLNKESAFKAFFNRIGWFYKALFLIVIVPLVMWMLFLLFTGKIE